MLLPLLVSAHALGITVALVASRWPAVGFAVLGVVLAAWSVVARRRKLGLAALCLALGIAAGLAALGGMGPGEAGGIEDAGDGPDRRIAGRVIRGPERMGDGTWRLALRVLGPDGRSAENVLRLDVRGEPPAVAPGDTVSFMAAPHPVLGLANPGLPDARLRSRAQGIDLVASLPSPDALTRVAEGAWWGPRRLASRARRALALAIDGRLMAREAGFVRAVALGERAGVDARAEEGFRAAGATHVLSVSGLHLAAVAGLLFVVLRWLAGRVGRAHGSPDAVAALAALPAVWAYTLLTGEAVATERSAIMATVALGAVALARPLSLGPSIACAAAVLLVRAPLVLVDPSFQLSFVSVAALGLAARPDGSRDEHATAHARLVTWVGRALAATVAASALTAPLVAHHFCEISPAAPIGNLVLVPLVELAVLPLGLVGALLAQAAPALGAPPLLMAGFAADAALAVADVFRRFAPALPVRAPSPWETAMFVAGAATGLVAWANRARSRRRAAVVVASAALLAVAAAGMGLREALRRSARDVLVTFLDVGQGDAAVVEGPAGFVALIDGGGTYDGAFDPGAMVIEPYLRRRGVARIDLVVLSHPHPDHMGGLFRVIERFDVGALWTSGDGGRNPAYRDLIALAASRRVALPRPAGLRSSTLALDPIAPLVGGRIAAPSGTTVNDASLVVRVGFAGRSFLFTGDLEQDGELELVGRAAQGQSVASDVMKVPHHGSATSSTSELLDAVRPGLAVMSLGRRNRFGFPRSEVLARYRVRAVPVLRTDRHGAVRVQVLPDGRTDTTCARACRSSDTR